MDVFSLRNNVVGDYGTYVRSFLTINDERIRRLGQEEMDGWFLWPDPLLQLNPSFEAGDTLQRLIADGELDPECINIFPRQARGRHRGRATTFPPPPDWLPSYAGHLRAVTVVARTKPAPRTMIASQKHRHAAASSLETS